jgi:hypothetical protein
MDLSKVTPDMLKLAQRTLIADAEKVDETYCTGPDCTYCRLERTIKSDVHMASLVMGLVTGTVDIEWIMFHFFLTGLYCGTQIGAAEYLDTMMETTSPSNT